MAPPRRSSLRATKPRTRNRWGIPLWTQSSLTRGTPRRGTTPRQPARLPPTQHLPRLALPSTFPPSRSTQHLPRLPLYTAAALPPTLSRTIRHPHTPESWPRTGHLRGLHVRAHAARIRRVAQVLRCAPPPSPAPPSSPAIAPQLPPLIHPRRHRPRRRSRCRHRLPSHPLQPAPIGLSLAAAVGLSLAAAIKLASRWPPPAPLTRDEASHLGPRATPAAVTCSACRRARRPSSARQPPATGATRSSQT